MRLDLATSRIQGHVSGEMIAVLKTCLVQDTLRRLLADAFPPLDGRTGRQAAADPQLREKLIQLVKSYVRGIDEDNLRSGRHDDINWLIRERGLAEIYAPAPPPRMRPPGASKDKTGSAITDELSIGEAADGMAMRWSGSRPRGRP